MRLAIRCLLATILLALLTGAAQAQWNYGQAQESRVLSDRWNVWVGGFGPTLKTDVAIGSPSVLGTLIRLEDTLGLEEDLSTGRVGGFYRFSNKRAILVDFISLNRSATRLLDTQIQIGDGDDSLTFDVGALVQTVFDNDILTVTYRHSFINSGKTEAGFTAGLSGFILDLAVRGVASVDDGVNPPEVRAAEGGDGLVVPVPAFGFFLNHAFTPKWILRMNAAFLNLDIGDFEGRYTTTNVSIEYFFTKNFGLGGGIDRQDLDFSNRGGENPYTVEYRIGGPSIYFSLAF